MASVRNDDYEVGSLRFLWNSTTAAGTGAIGLAALFGGIALSATFWLIPVGVPLALFGVAMLTTAGGGHR
jgi:hypothetical protein